MTSAGNPFVYYGEEIGMYGKKDNGDEGVREPMLWAPSASDSYRCTWHSPQYSTDNTVGNVESQSEYFNSILNWYKFFIKLRNNHPALAEGTMSLPDGFNDSDSSDKNFMVFYRTAPSEKLLVIHNVSESTATYVLEKSIAEPVADTGLTTLTRVSDTKYNITMPAYSSIIIKMP
jgi:glycosidase